MGRAPSGPPARPNLRQIAAAAGVSKSTVSNLLNSPDIVAAETRQRVEQAMVEQGYVRNSAARQLRAGTSQIVGCMILDVSNPYFADVARGAEDRLAESGMMMLLCSLDVESSRQEHYLRTLEFVHTIREHEAAWRTWFDRNGVQPVELTYERLVADPAEAVGQVAARLGVVLPPNWSPPPTDTRQADDLSRRWATTLRAALDAEPGHGGQVQPDRSATCGRAPKIIALGGIRCPGPDRPDALTTPVRLDHDRGVPGSLPM